MQVPTDYLHSLDIQYDIKVMDSSNNELKQRINGKSTKQRTPSNPYRRNVLSNSSYQKPYFVNRGNIRNPSKSNLNKSRGNLYSNLVKTKDNQIQTNISLLSNSFTNRHHSPQKQQSQDRKVVKVQGQNRLKNFPRRRISSQNSYRNPFRGSLNNRNNYRTPSVDTHSTNSSINNNRKGNSTRSNLFLKRRTTPGGYSSKVPVQPRIRWNESYLTQKRNRPQFANLGKFT